MKTLDDHKREIAALIEKLIAARAEYNRLVSDEEEEEQLGRPATPEEIAALEKRLGKPLPPSYRAFLELHNGWKEFDGEGHLLSTEDHASKWLPKRIKSLEDLFDEFGEFEDGDNRRSAGPFKAGMLPVMIGETIRNFLVLDPGKPQKNGEMAFHSYDLTEREETFKDFTSFLRDSLDITLSLVRDEKSGSDEEDEED